MEYTIPLQLVEIEAGNYHLAASCRFKDGSAGIWIIDTGASKTVFDQSLALHYDLAGMEEQAGLQSAGIGAARVETTLGVLNPFSFGNFQTGPMQVALIDLSHINQFYSQATEKEICGLIGGDFLLDHKAVIDYGTLSMVLKT